jgi:hypothetical protein
MTSVSFVDVPVVVDLCGGEASHVLVLLLGQLFATLAVLLVTADTTTKPHTNRPMTHSLQTPGYTLIVASTVANLQPLFL